MKVAVTDACIFICLRDLDLFEHLFQLNYEIHSSLDVFNELYDDQKQALLIHTKTGKFIIHSVSELERLHIHGTNYPSALSEADRTVLYLSGKLCAVVLSSDNVLRKYAIKHGMECHGMLWIIDQLVQTQALSDGDAVKKLEHLLFANIFYQNNSQLVSEIQKRLKLWKR